MKKTKLATALDAVNKPIQKPAHKPKAPEHVTILGLGPSLSDYVDITKRLGGRRAYSDEVWGINALGDVIACDLIFHMDDVRIQEIRAKARPTSNIARMLEWMRVAKTPIITSRSHKDYPSLVEFPLQDVMEYFHWNGYFNNTAAYAVAYAIYKGVKKVSMFGVDFTYPNSHDAERGRACVEYWIGYGMAKGVTWLFPKTSTIIDSMYPERDRFYGYDTVDVNVFENSSGKREIAFVNKVDLPTADEIEAAYDHTKHPNPHVKTNGT